MKSKSKNFYSHGKLLLTGEYVVLDGALSLAVPTKFGQSLKVEFIEELKIIWKSCDSNGQIWFEDSFLINDIFSNKIKFRNDLSERLVEILLAAKSLNPEFLNGKEGFKINTNLEFPKNWGLGTSSTLINNVAKWADVDAYELVARTFGGSGYDIACAQHDSPITYQLKPNDREVKKVDFDPAFKENIYFVYLNKKQNSRDGISQYKSNKKHISQEILEISTMTSDIVKCRNLIDFQKFIELHEQIISSIIKQKTIKELLFSDFEGSIKSLGAWGGDFVMVASEQNPTNYFKYKGFETILMYTHLIKIKNGI